MNGDRRHIGRRHWHVSCEAAIVARVRGFRRSENLVYGVTNKQLLFGNTKKLSAVGIDFAGVCFHPIQVPFEKIPFSA